MYVFTLVYKSIYVYIVFILQWIPRGRTPGLSAGCATEIPDEEVLPFGTRFDDLGMLKIKRWVYPQ
jgi:hypothetical protein